VTSIIPTMLQRTYFVLFNLISALGWAYCWFIVVTHLHEFSEPKGAENLWAELRDPLVYTQTMALMEIVHSALGMTKSPVVQTTIQVFSRILLVWGVTLPSQSAQKHWSLYLMALSWATTEIPRYLFYATKQVSKKAPSMLFHLRYSLFYILYPTGISGEVLQIWTSLPSQLTTEWLTLLPTGLPDTCISVCKACENHMGCALSVAILVTYAFFGPVMVFLMHLTRKGAYKKRFPRKVKPDTAKGILFPLINGQRSTSEAGKAVLCAAITAGEDIVPVAAAKARTERNWRFKYKTHFKSMFLESLKSPEKALSVAKAGADFLHNNFQFRRKDGSVVAFKTEMERKDTCFVGTARVGGEGEKLSELTVPYKPWTQRSPGKILKGDDVKALADRWANYGTIEPDAAASIKAVVDNPKLLDLSNHYFVLIGAGSAMGPFNKLMELGANIIALDIPGAWERPGRPSVWRRLMKTAKASKGKMIFPLNKKMSECKGEDDIVKAAGANLMEQPADILNWLMSLPEVKDSKNHITIGNYTYLDGALHVKLSVCADAIMKELADRRPVGTTSLAYLCTPTDMHVITDEASKAAEANYNSFLLKPLGAMVETALQKLSGGKWLRSNIWRTDLPLVDGLIVNQGPNYALAKRLQHWRAIIAYSKGVPVSTNIAPSTATISVVRATTFKWAYGGIPYFKPYEIFDQETTNAVMTAALIYDIKCKDSAAYPSNREKKQTSVKNPLELFKYNSFHGGVWRSPYTMDSLGVTSVIIYFMGGPNLFIPVTVAITGAVTAAVAQLVVM